MIVFLLILEDGLSQDELTRRMREDKSHTARDLFNLSEEAIKTMDKKRLTRIYRKLAGKHHPDKGGDHDRFVEINEAFQALMKIIS